MKKIMIKGSRSRQNETLSFCSKQMGFFNKINYREEIYD
jgi:hypothetical protein